MKILKPKISKKKIVIFSVFLFIATIFWFLNALNKEYTTKIDYPVSYSNFPKNVISQSSSPDELSVTIDAYGFDILWKLAVSEPLNIDIQKHAVKDKNDSKKLIISTNVFIEDLFPNIADIKVLNIKPETITFETKEISTKKVPVKSNINFSTKELYMLSGSILFEPDTILLFAAKEDLVNINIIQTEEVNFDNLDDTLIKKINLEKIKNINYSVNSIKLTIPIEKYTEKTTTAIVNVENCPDSLRVITFPKETKITYRVTLSQYDSISDRSFKLYVDYNDITEKKFREASGLYKTIP